VFLIFHYNLEGSFSDFWSEDDKQAFLKLANEYKSQILGIMVGHKHQTYQNVWNGFKVFSAAGSELMKIMIDETYNVSATTF
jgi:hypothetical protein